MNTHRKKKERIAVHTLFCAKLLTSLLSHVLDVHVFSFFFSYQIKADIDKINREVITKKNAPFSCAFFFLSFCLLLSALTFGTNPSIHFFFPFSILARSQTVICAFCLFLPFFSDCFFFICVCVCEHNISLCFSTAFHYCGRKCCAAVSWCCCCLAPALPFSRAH